MEKEMYKYAASLLLAGLLAGCSDVTEEMDPSPASVEEEFSLPGTITVSLADPSEGKEASSRLTYEEAKMSGGTGLKTKWESDDELIITIAGYFDYYATYKVAEGQNTDVATFEKSVDNWNNSHSTTYCIYYPASSIKSDEDFLNHTYAGQAQSGNDNTNHLKEYHTIRKILSYTSATLPEIDNITLAGDDVIQSACMKFNLSGLPNITPTEIGLRYIDSNGAYSSCFYTHDYLSSYYGTVVPNGETTSLLTLALEGFSQTTSITAYMMMSCATVNVQAGGKFRVYVTGSDGSKYYTDKPIAEDATLTGGRYYSITCSDGWTPAGTVDAFDNETSGTTVLQEATAAGITAGADIIIMGDGFTLEDFGTNGAYEKTMKQAYNDFFSIEPFKSLQSYFNVYYVNAVSPQKSGWVATDNVNGATQQTETTTVFNTTFQLGATTIQGNNDMVLQYAIEALKQKGGKGGASCEESEATGRANTALMIVMVNVNCYAGTCSLAWSSGSDYGRGYSVAYTALGRTGADQDNQRKYTTIHEAGGHGFGKLADEYGGNTSFNTGLWTDLSDNHGCGVSRNVDAYWDSDLQTANPTITKDLTTESNVYWSSLLSGTYSYKTSEGLGFYEGANTYESFFCRPTKNSVMRNQFDPNGQFFNAPSRWAIYYRLMRLTGATTATDYAASLEEFAAWDKANISITLEQTESSGAPVLSRSAEEAGYKPLAPPVLIGGRWENGRFVKGRP